MHSFVQSVWITCGFPALGARPYQLAVVCGAVFVWAASADFALAQEADGWPVMSEEARSRGPGLFLSVGKIALVWLLFLLWVRTADWVNRDIHERRWKYATWNSVIVFPFLAAMIVLWIVPSFWIGFPILVMAYVGPLLAYVAQRNPMVMDDEKVLTVRHLKSLLASALSPVGVKIEVDKPDPRDEGPAIEIFPSAAGGERDARANFLRARQAIGFAPVRRLLGEAMAHRAESVAVDLLPARTEVRLQIDGVWHPFEPEDVATGASMADVLKLIAGLDCEEHVARQSGHFALEFRRTRHACEVVTEMAKTGERALVRFDIDADPFETLADLGMRDKTQAALKEVLAAKQGVVIFSALPRNGLSTTINVALMSTDRLMREVYAIEPAERPERHIENVAVVKYEESKKQTPAHVLPALLRKYPDVIIHRDWADVESATQLCQIGATGKLVVGSIAAKDAIESLLRVLMVRVASKTFADSITAVMGQRLLRKLCESCKQAYVPTAEELRPFGIPEGRVKELYRVPLPDPTKRKTEVPHCENCEGIGYAGRTAVFEFALVTDEMRRLLTENPKMDALRTAARAAKVRSLLEEAVLLAASGVTSLEEVNRVFKSAN
jgi:type II secretory ATPase GspE/PulE/Tfp pilus assembly ATPase PilB-like protein